MVQIQEATRTDILLRTLKAAARDHGPAAFYVEGSAEDAVIAHAILSAGVGIELFTVPAAAVSSECSALVERIRARYGYEVRVYGPEIAATQYADWYGFGVADPLKLALLGKNAWISGLRQTPGSRHTVPPFEYDAAHGVLKFNPLADWTERDVQEYRSEHGLHALAVPASEPAINRIAA
jgi:phosphoadenosine phosphosulfate reductase